MSSTWFCPRCGAANDPVLTHCSACGKRFLSQRKRNDGERAKLFTRRRVLTGLALAGAGAGVGLGGLIGFRWMHSLHPSLVYRGHKSSVVAVVWSSDGKRLASCDRAGTVQVWEAGTGKTHFTSRSPAAVTSPAAWSPSGNYLVAQSATYDGSVDVWNATSGSPVLAYRGHTRQIYSLSWAPSGNLLASGSSDGTLQVWDATTGKQRWTSPAALTPSQTDTNGVIEIAWSPDGSRLASALLYGGQVSVWNATTGSMVLTHQGPLPYPDWVKVAWSPSGKQLVTVCWQDTGNSDDSPPPPIKAQVWESTTGRPVVTSPTGSAFGLLQAVAWTSGGKRIVFTDAQTLWMWEAREGGQLSTIPVSSFPPIVYDFASSPTLGTLMFSPDGKQLAAGYGETVLIWDVL